MDILLISAAIAAISLTITKSIIFKYFRDWFKIPFLSKLFKCPYCLSHWLSFVLVIPISNSLFDWIIKSFAAVTFSSILSILVYYYMRQVDE